MDWEDLRYVLAIEQSGSLTGAAERLGVARTTVGRRLDTLEASMGVLLFDRTPDGFVATASGQDLADVAKAVETQVLEVEGRVSGRDAKLRGRLRVSTVDFVYRAFADVFSKFAQRYPGVELTVLGDYEEVSLRRREADVVLRLSNTPAAHLVGRRLGVIEVGLYAAQRLVDKIGADAPLDRYPFLREDERRESPEVRMWLAQHAPGAPVAMRFESYGILRTAIAAGVGVYILPRIDADPDPALARVGPPTPGAGRGLWALTLPELITNSRVRAFLDHVYEEMKGRLPSSDHDQAVQATPTSATDSTIKKK